uniref:Uncharacterized protein n=1 Tax=Rhizophora mucronata TaxID=61149 RepID=A0A2P2QT51_RHIMU
MTLQIQLVGWKGWSNFLIFTKHPFWKRLHWLLPT